MSTLDLIERRGTLTYSYDGIKIETMDGWFMLSMHEGSKQYGRSIIARRIGGRNRWVICSDLHVLSFKQSETSAA